MVSISSLVAHQERRQVDEDRVLVAHAQAEQPAELIADDRLHDQRFGQPQRQLSSSAGARTCSCMRARPSIHSRSGDIDDVDVVVEHVVADRVVLVVEAAARAPALCFDA